jgi:hypothetical protein
MGGYGRPGRQTGGGYCVLVLAALPLVAVLASMSACAHEPAAVGTVDPRCRSADPGDDRTPDELGCVEDARGRWVPPSPDPHWLYRWEENPRRLLRCSPQRAVLEERWYLDRSCHVVGQAR